LPNVDQFPNVLPETQQQICNRAVNDLKLHLTVSVLVHYLVKYMLFV